MTGTHVQPQHRTTHEGGAMRRMAQAQGIFNVLGGLWPLMSLRTFEAVYGPKTDHYLQHTVGGLLTTVGAAQLLSKDDDAGTARALGIGTAVTLLAIDAAYIPRGRMSRAYLQDAACEVAWLAGWVWASRRTRTRA